MVILMFLLVFLAFAVLAPRFGSDSRGLSDRRRPDTYPAMPAAARRR